ncbi:MAG: hypothetical protein IJN01_02555 [Rikenellaceae bacterium]|nr:hypothetical protein [Rikenellaceae bacterium]
MKKFLLILAVVFGLSTTAMAQQKGDAFIGGAIGFSAGTDQSASFGLAVEGGGFVANRLALSGSLAYNLVGGEIHVVTVGPKLSYYARLADKFYYTPGVSVVGAYVNVGGADTAGAGLGLDLAAFEFRPTPHFGMNVNLFSMSGIFLSDEFSFSVDMMMNTSVSFRYYF